MESRLVRVYAQRHGEKCGDFLTEQGREEVRTSLVSGPLAGVNFAAYYASPKNRAIETAEIVSENRDFIRVSYGLVPPLTDLQAKFIWDEAEKKIGDKAEVTILDWADALPSQWGGRMFSQLWATFSEMAREVARENPGDDPLNIYVAGHSPVLELALPENDMRVPRLPTAGVIIYIMKIHGSHFGIQAVEIPGNG